MTFKNIRETIPDNLINDVISLRWMSSKISYQLKTGETICKAEFFMSKRTDILSDGNMGAGPGSKGKTIGVDSVEHKALENKILGTRI